MIKPFLFVIAVGIALGLAWPSSGNRAAALPASPGTALPRETTLQREGNGHFYTHATVNGELVRFLVDTGATSVALTIADAERLGLAVDPSSFTVVGEGASGPVRGKQIMLDSVDIDGKRVTDVRAVILQGSRLSLLGQSYLSRMGEVQMKGDYMVLR